MLCLSPAKTLVPGLLLVLGDSTSWVLGLPAGLHPAESSPSPSQSLPRIPFLLLAQI